MYFENVYIKAALLTSATRQVLPYVPDSLSLKGLIFWLLIWTSPQALRVASYVNANIKSDTAFKDDIMNQDLIFYAILLISYLIIFVFQNQAIKSLKSTTEDLKSQLESNRTLMSSFKEFKELLDVDDFKKHVALKLENKDLEVDKVIREKESKLLDIVMKTVTNELYEKDFLPKAYDELASIAIGVVIRSSKTHEEKVEKIKKFYPVNSKAFIQMLSGIESGDLKPNS
jgi:hypothetical protein